jgi:hypothetical protein
MTRRKNAPLIDSTQFVGIVIMTIAILLIIDFGRRTTTGYYVAQAEEQLKAEISAELTRQAQLKERRDYVMSDEYVEKWARERARLIRPGDQPLILVTDKTSPSVSTVPQPSVPVGTLAPEPVWHEWWRLFFDTEPSISLP